MSFSEFILIFCVAFFVIKPEDLKFLVKKIFSIRSYITDSYTKVNSFIESNITDKEITILPNDETEQINSYLSKILSAGYAYEGEYDLDKVKKFYEDIIKLQSLRIDK